MNNVLDLFNRRAERLAARRDTLLDDAVDTARRSLLAKSMTLGAGAVGTAAALMAPTSAKAQTVSDADVLNFALNLEYLEAEYYLRATTGNGLDASLVGSSPGTVTGGRQVTFDNALFRQYANEIATDERNHVAFLRTALGSSAVSRPAINIQDSFTALFRAAGIIGASDTFDPYASDVNFLLGAFVFEDVGVTAYKGASPLIANKTYLDAAAGILAVEAYHAGLIRTALYALGADMPQLNTRQNTDKLAAARAVADGTLNADGSARAGQTQDDQGVSIGQDPTFQDTDASNITPFNADAIAFSRSTGQVLNVVYLNTASAAATAGGFFPSGMNGTIRTSAAK